MPMPDSPPRPPLDLLEIFSRYKPELVSFLLRRKCRRSELDDITQEVFTKVWAMKDPSQIRDFGKYLPTVAWNVVKAGRKRDARSAVTFDSWLAESASERPVPFQWVSAEQKAEVRRDLIRVSRCLTRQQRRVLKLRFYEIPLEEIAQRMSISRDQVRYLIKQANARIRAKW
jgi:RNA polymerase sigma factor (sigma-70 family)